MFELKQIFGLKTNFLEHLRVQRCVKDYFLKFSIKHYSCSRPVLPSYLKILLNHVKGLKYFYETLNDQYKNLSLRNKWNNVLNTTINYDEWNKIFRNCFKTICRNDLIWLQFCIIQRILSTRAHLQKININNYAFCVFCQSSAETIYHLFAACPIAIDFWRNVR